MPNIHIGERNCRCNQARNHWPWRVLKVIGKDKILAMGVYIDGARNLVQRKGFLIPKLCRRLAIGGEDGMDQSQGSPLP